MTLSSRSSRSALSLTALATLGLAAARPAAAQGFTGQSVQVTQRFPDMTTVVEDDGTRTVTPTGATFTDTSGITTVVTPTQIQFSLGPSFSALDFSTSESFNGFVVSETGSSPTAITGFSIDPATNVTGFDRSQVTLDSTDIFANFRNLTFQPGQNVTLDLTFSPSAVPEASTTISFGLLLALGLGALVVAAKRKKASIARTATSAT
jgi:hypothetical protein